MRLVIFLLLHALSSGSASSMGYHLYKHVAPYAEKLEGTGYPSLTFQEYTQWRSWKAVHDRQYDTHQEQIYRLSVWLANMRYIEDHNRKANVNGFTLEMNSFGDLTLKEWTTTYSCHKIDSFFEENEASKTYQPPTGWDPSSAPYSIDWRSKSAVTKVQNQEEYRCHSCYAFAAIGALEGAHAIRTGQLISLSEQQIIDCSVRYANSGCQGGNYKFAWNYIIHIGGADKASYYPYKPKTGSSCRFKEKYIAASMTSYRQIRHGNESDLQAAVGFVGPVAVTIDHSQKSFQFYSGGIYKESKCSTSSRNATHEMVVVGYGMNNYGTPYWIAKNSYGSNWGTSGYMYIERGSNVCGIASNAAVPII